MSNVDVFEQVRDIKLNSYYWCGIYDVSINKIGPDVSDAIMSMVSLAVRDILIQQITSQVRRTVTGHFEG